MRRGSVQPLAVVAALALAGCHVVVREPVTRPGTVERIRHPEGAIARRPTVVLSEAGMLQFVEPLECPTEELERALAGTEITTRPNLATFAVASIAGALGAVMLVRGLAGDDPGGDPLVYAGAAGLAVGVPLAIGPWIGTGTELRAAPDAPATRRPGPSEPCGTRPLAARAATLAILGVEVRGTVDRDGTFSVSPFQLIDAFEAAGVAALDVSGTLEGGTGDRTIAAVIEAGALSGRAAAWLARADFDAAIEPMRVIPNLVPGVVRVSLTSTGGAPAVRVVLPIRNDGPGGAWALRGHVVAPRTRAIDGRVIYVGAVGKGASVTRELLIPVTEAAAGELRNAAIELSIELRDAHGTAPSTPVRYRGPVFVDAPR